MANERRETTGKIGSSLDGFFGTWTAEEAAEFNAFIEETHMVDYCRFTEEALEEFNRLPHCDALRSDAKRHSERK